MTAPRSILLLHGFVSTSDSYFLPSLKKRYALHRVFAPDLPDPAHPDLDAWTAAIEALPVRELDLIVAHSLGGTFAWSLLSRKVISCKTLVTLGSSPGPKEHADLQGFLRYPLNFAAVREQVRTSLLVHSLDDPWVFPEYALVAMRHTKGRTLFYTDQGHFEQEELPEEVLTLLDRSLA